MFEEKLWLWKLRHGDAEALRCIYDRYKHDMLGLAVSLSADRAAGEDAVHDVFVSFVRRVPQLRLRTSLRGYLLSSVANRVRNARRTDARRPQPAEAVEPMTSDSQQPERIAVQTEQAMLIEQAMAQLPYDQQEAVILHLQVNRRVAGCIHQHGPEPVSLWTAATPLSVGWEGDAMKDHSEFEDSLRDFCRMRHAATQTTPLFDEKVVDDALAAQRQTQPERSRPAGSGVRRIMMHSRFTSLTAAAVVTVAVVVGVSVFHDGATPAYAVEQTVAAIKWIETVYMKGEFYLQGPFECWMRFDGNPDRPTHV